MENIFLAILSIYHYGHNLLNINEPPDPVMSDGTKGAIQVEGD